MAATDDRHAGTNAGRIQGQIKQIRNWMAGADYEGMAGDIDRVLAEIDLYAEIDPTLSASDNWRIIKDKYGLMTASDRQREARKTDDKAEDSARRAVREHLAAIDAGEADDILADIRAEYGAEFVDAELEQARAEADVELGGAPEPNAHSPSATANANGPAGEPAADPEPAPTPEPAAPTISPADDGRPSPGRTPAPGAAPSRAVEWPDIRSLVSAALAPIKLICVVLYVALALPWDATHPEVTAADV